jgi:hypothetical protein
MTMSLQDLEHLKSNHVCRLALQLDEDVYGAHGVLSDREIVERLAREIGSSNAIVRDGKLSVTMAVNLIISVWKHKDR